MSYRASPRGIFELLLRIGVLSASIALTAVAIAEPIRHRVRLEGRGSPTVVFESGLGDTLETWQSIQPKVAACTRTLAYNRAGYAGSTAPGEVRDAKTIVSELREELRKRGVRPPYVLVGHSLGGLYMQYFARNYPEEVAGLVLVDSTHWNQGLVMGSPNETHDAPTHRRTIVFMSFIARRELANSSLAGEQVHASPSATDIPTIVLSSTGALLGETPAARALGAQLQEEIAADFPGAQHVRVAASGHYIQRDRPEVVVEAIRRLANCRSSQSAAD
jgi:pimeloyl-ACP methyl ester carboxylesterase